MTAASLAYAYEGRSERRSMTFRMPTPVIDLLEQAATCAHKDKTALVVEAVADRAREILLDRTIFALPDASYEAFVTALDNPPEPNECLKALARRKPVWEK